MSEKDSKKAKVGSIRPSQLLWTYGPGSMIDLPNISALTMGIDYWNVNDCENIEEPRLLEAVQDILGVHVKSLKKPLAEEDSADPLESGVPKGVPVKPFPRWLRCIRCGILGEYDSSLFSPKVNIYRPEETHFMHIGCDKGKKSVAVPSRFLVACANGHLDDFPWEWFVHKGASDCRGTLRFLESGSFKTDSLWVKCDTCGASRSMVKALVPDKNDKNVMPACRGHHPHLGLFEEGCNEKLVTINLGATNTWFPFSLSALAIPLSEDPLEQFVQDYWDDLKEAEDASELKGMMKGIKRKADTTEIDHYANEAIWQVISKRLSGEVQTESKKISVEEQIRRPEWEVLISPKSNNKWPHFMSEQTSVPAKYVDKIQAVFLIKRLREINTLLGFSRIESPEEISDEKKQEKISYLSKDNQAKWVPANEVYGEGVFIRFNEDAIQDWMQLDSVKARDACLLAGHRVWRKSRRLDPNLHYPSIKYAMLHTFAHLLIRELALECGYNASSIRERIYSSNEVGQEMAGILIYTAAADSDGTLGGLVDLGKPENLEHIISQALQRATICSSDPLCSDHSAEGDRSLHSAACHACSFVAETSCEKGNKYLDRALLLPTFECKDAGFFK